MDVIGKVVEVVEGVKIDHKEFNLAGNGTKHSRQGNPSNNFTWD